MMGIPKIINIVVVMLIVTAILGACGNEVKNEPETAEATVTEESTTDETLQSNASIEKKSADGTKTENNLTTKTDNAVKQKSTQEETEEVTETVENSFTDFQSEDAGQTEYEYEIYIDEQNGEDSKFNNDNQTSLKDEKIEGQNQTEENQTQSESNDSKNTDASQEYSNEDESEETTVEDEAETNEYGAVIYTCRYTESGWHEWEEVGHDVAGSGHYAYICLSCGEDITDDVDKHNCTGDGCYFEKSWVTDVPAYYVHDYWECPFCGEKRYQKECPDK